MQQRQRGAELRIEGGGHVTVLAASFSFGGGLPLRVAHGYNSLCYLSSQQMEASGGACTASEEAGGWIVNLWCSFILEIKIYKKSVKLRADTIYSVKFYYWYRALRRQRLHWPAGFLYEAATGQRQRQRPEPGRRGSPN